MHRIEQTRHQRQPLALALVVMIEDVLRHADPDGPSGWLQARDSGLERHCYPYHSQAAYLANVMPHVYLDIGLAIPHVGQRAAAVLAETLELAPFHKLLYSSDAYGLAELYLEKPIVA